MVSFPLWLALELELQLYKLFNNLAQGRENIAEMTRWIGQKNWNVGLISLLARQNYLLSIRSIWFLSLILYIFFKVFCSNGVKTVKNIFLYHSNGFCQTEFGSKILFYKLGYSWLIRIGCYSADAILVFIRHRLNLFHPEFKCVKITKYFKSFCWWFQNVTK